MTIFATILLGILMSIAAFITGYGVGSDNDDWLYSGISMAFVVIIVTLIFLLVLTA